MNIPQLITDLAIMMLTAGIIAIIFKKIRQPLVLGYILAGFLLSPYFPWFSTILDTESIETWSEIGIIFLMFHLGLEFNMHKLAEVGSTAIITCIVDVVVMMALGYGTGVLLDFTVMDSVVLGGMLAMSSTMVIIKVFDEKGIKGKFTEGVFGTLVIQDIVGIFMMVVLSTVSVSRNVSGSEVAGQLAMMMLYLVIWLVLGILILPTFLDKTIKYMNDEMLMVLSIGICFGMVLLANWLGFSSALGAFLSGSLLAGTVHVERVEHLTKGIKDMFGAVFFVSVGMMVDPEMIVKYIVPIAVIVAVTIVGKIVANSLGMLISGQNLSTSIKSGFALAQIGEFAFIIASLGNSLGVIDSFLYPISVAVSVITIFTTPFCIQLAGPFDKWLEKRLPEKLLSRINRFTSEDQADKEHDSEWMAYIKRYFVRMLVFGGFMLVGALVGIHGLYPLLFLKFGIPHKVAKIVATVLIYALILLLAAPLLDRHNSLFTSLWLKGLSYRLPLGGLNAIKYFIIVVIAMIPLRYFFRVRLYIIAVIVAIVLILLSRNSFTATWYLQLETAFLRNFNERLIKKEEQEGRKQEWLDTKLHIISFYADESFPYLGKSLEKLDWGKRYNIYVVKICKADKQYLLPESSLTIEPGDKVFIVGEKTAIYNFYQFTGVEKTKRLRTLKQFMETGYADTDNALAMCPIKIHGDEEFSGKVIRQGHLRDKYHVAIMGMQKDGLPIIMPSPNMLISKDDILWIMGSNKNVGRLISDYVDEA